MNEFVVKQKKPLTPSQIVASVTGMSMDELITKIRENRGGQYDHLYREQSGVGKTRQAAGSQKEAPLNAL